MNSVTASGHCSLAAVALIRCNKPGDCIGHPSEKSPSPPLTDGGPSMSTKTLAIIQTHSPRPWNWGRERPHWPLRRVNSARSVERAIDAQQGIALRLIGTDPDKLDVLHDGFSNLIQWYAEKFIDAAMSHAKEYSITPIGGAPPDTIQAGEFVIAVVRKAIRSFARYIGHDDFLRRWSSMPSGRRDRYGRNDQPSYEDAGAHRSRWATGCVGRSIIVRAIRIDTISIPEQFRRIELECAVILSRQRRRLFWRMCRPHRMARKSLSTAITVSNIGGRREAHLVRVKIEQVQLIEDVHGKASSANLHPAGRARASPTTPIRTEEAQRPWKKSHG